MTIIANEAIKAKQVRMVTDEGNTVMTLEKAISIAYDQDLDLIQITNEGGIPVVKAGDLNKVKYDAAQAKKQQAKKQRQQIQTKEIQFSTNTDVNDLNTKARKCIEFLNSGKHVKLVMKFPTRQQNMTQHFKEQMLEFVKLIGIEVEFVQQISFLPRSVICIIKK